ncbi:succinate dehydrogenase, hydrophobic membrane anchor protein [Brevundimonas sp. AJA228-03]|uniref:succinate dehydrogenase, hydrophobic membrane anchor protein n=1 Tax=Brevundimonas sp. AJA228-03 TaxID=2752515 RepID=UPI001ADFD80F|nr:succinate dehydrogenase, hydrophobic membrane anchor protein [Brevundimonas sp. AJA228-03]QTN20021.1 succinate dehydrogenase, hydrophobic membrane anchor protein [Brevundimonas sp. AJA228-03]
MSHPARYRNGVRVSERHGAGEWTLEKILLAALMPLGLWIASTAFTLSGQGYDAVLQWFASPVNAALLAATALILFGFASLAWKVIIEDYIHVAGTRALLIGLVNLICLAAAAASVFFIVRLALGSAPLPAGFGI